MRLYTQEMRINNEPCPYCGVWHSAASHPPQFQGYIIEIQLLEEKAATLEALLTEAEQALDKLSCANNGILWLGNNIHNYGGDDFLNFMHSAIEDSKTASAATVATLAKLKAH